MCFNVVRSLKLNGNRNIQASDGNCCVLTIKCLILFRENEFFQRVWGVFVLHVETLEGWASVPFKNGKSREVGRANWNSIRGGGLDIFWNYTLGFGKWRNLLLLGEILTNLGFPCSWRSNKYKKDTTDIRDRNSGILPSEKWATTRGKEDEATFSSQPGNYYRCCSYFMLHAVNRKPFLSLLLYTWRPNSTMMSFLFDTTDTESDETLIA